MLYLESYKLSKYSTQKTILVTLTAAARRQLVTLDKGIRVAVASWKLTGRYTTSSGAKLATAQHITKFWLFYFQKTRKITFTGQDVRFQSVGNEKGYFVDKQFY